MNVVFGGVVLLHGLIHFMGFAKGRRPDSLKALTQPVGFWEGNLWLVTAIAFVGTGVMIILRLDYWLPVGIIAAVISQMLIIRHWKEARLGTIVNVGIGIGAYLVSQHIDLGLF